MKNTITITCTTIAVTITTANTPPRTAVTTDDSHSHLLSDVAKKDKAINTVEMFHFLPENMIYKGLNDEEAVFLQQLADKRAQVEAETRNEEKEELQAYRVSEHQHTDTDPTVEPRSIVMRRVTNDKCNLH